MIIYLVTNLITHKIYIGCTVCRLNVRQSCHKYNSKQEKPKLYFHKSIKKYGWNNFKWDIIWEGDSVDEMHRMETCYIKEYNCMAPNGYNLTEGNDNTTLGYKFTTEQLKRLRQIKRNMKNPPNKGNKWSDEQKKAASERQKKNHKHLCGENNPSKRPEVRKKISEINMGSKNGMSKTFLLTDPDGNEIIINGGIKRKLKELGLSYPSFRKTGKARGWTLKTI